MHLTTTTPRPISRLKARLASIAALAMMVSWLVACGGGGGGGGGGGVGALPVGVTPTTASAPASAAVQPSQSANFVIESKAVAGVSYSIQTYVPAGYANDTVPYPVVYALDGDAVFNGQVSRFENFRVIAERREAKVIIVAIGGTARRQTDYNLPGARPYHDFLVGELIPAVESRFRTDPSRRILSGLSTSGNLALSALFLEAPGRLAFTHFISVEGAFWQQSAELQALEQAMAEAAAGRALPVTVVLASCISGCNETYVQSMYERLSARQFQNFNLLRTAYSGGHAQVDLPAFEDTVTRFMTSAR